MTVATFLGGIPVLAGVPAEQIERLAAGVRVLSAPAGAVELALADMPVELLG